MSKTEILLNMRTDGILVIIIYYLKIINRFDNGIG